MQFDEHGLLLPYSITELLLPEFQSAFVDGLEDVSHRNNLFQQYLQFVGELKIAFGATFFQWIDGSFVTTKATPGDIRCGDFPALRHHEPENQRCFLL